MTHKQFAIKLAHKAGAIMRRHFSDEITKDIKPDTTFVTIADHAINSMVVREVKKRYPKYGIIAEEGGSANENADLIWMCDPLDGTLPYAHAIPTSTFSLALIFKGKPILGVLYDPFMNRLYSAELGKGATLNGKRLYVMKARSLKGKVVGMVEWPTAEQRIRKFPERLMKIGGQPLNVVSTAYFGMLVASGQLIANVFGGHRPWDVAAQKIIIEEAGGTVTDLDGNDQRYDRLTNGFVGSNGTVHTMILRLLKK
ncbi:MAG: hypothetical protein PHY34_04605 [Patescibacteria group bacterium]|nr:hypothetical protein [Patescibacteria group bacterium]